MNCYGLAEASGLSTWVPEGDTPEHVEKTVGIPMPHCEVAILDINTGEVLSLEMEGKTAEKGLLDPMESATFQQASFI